MKTYKAITYAYPTSLAAKYFGYAKEGCFYIQLTHVDTESAYSEAAPGSEGFLTVTDPDLKSLFAEYNYEVEPQSLKYHLEYYL